VLPLIPGSSYQRAYLGSLTPQWDGRQPTVRDHALATNLGPRGLPALHEDSDRGHRNWCNRFTPTMEFRVLTEHIGNPCARKHINRIFSLLPANGFRLQRLAVQKRFLFRRGKIVAPFGCLRTLVDEPAVEFVVRKLAR
jgi:hypothetical protein